MSKYHVFVVIILHAIIQLKCSIYYFSYTPLTWNNAELYCQQHCASTLASIHTIYDLAFISELLSNNTFATNSNLWIGLYKNASGNYKWSDNTSFDFGSNEIISTTNNNYFALNYDDSTDSYTFNNINSDTTQQMFLCNECEWDVLSKYVYIPSTTQQSAELAETTCNNIYGTSLASIHSISDNNNIKLLSELSDDQNDGTYIGLNDKISENIYQWNDNSTFNYIHNNITNINNEDCVYLNKITGDWISIVCSLPHDYSIICNAMNKFCDADGWDIDVPSQWIFSPNACDVYNAGNIADTFTMRRFLVRSYQYTKLYVEYTWKMDLNSPYKGANQNEQSFSGLVINIMDSNTTDENAETVPFYVGVQLMNGKIFLFFRNKDRLPEITRSDDLTGLIDLNQDINLQIKFENHTFFLTLNENSTYMSPQYVKSQIPLDYYVRGISVQNSKISSWSKSLLYNGWSNKSYIYTLNPTSDPTYNPTQIPTKNPNTPNPTQTPTKYPSQSPIIITGDPSKQPTISPTPPDCSISNAIWAEWSRSYLQIHIYVPFRHNKKTKQVDQIIRDESKYINDCNYIFDSETILLLGNDAECYWVENKWQANLQNVDEDVILLINLAPTSTINQTDSVVFLDQYSGAMKYFCTATGEYSDIIIPNINRPIDPYPPQIILSKTTTQIGICDDLELDARSTTFMGGRDNGIFRWGITHTNKNKRYPSNYYYGQYIEIGNKLLFDKLVLYDLSLTVTNWYNETSVVIFDVFVSDQAIPKVSLSGTHIYKAIRFELNGYINVYSNISFNKDCLSNDAPDVQYALSWSVNAIKLYNDTMSIDTDLLTQFNQHLKDNYNNIDAIDIYADDYLQPGLIYIFTLNVLCNGGNYICDINATHDLTFDYSELKCSIAGTNIYLSDIDPIYDLNALIIPIDGDRFTWDPDKLDSKGTTSKTHLIWDWECYDIYANNSCQYLMQDTTTSIVNIDFSNKQWEQLTSYSFEFTMTVYDGDNSGKLSCSDIFLLQIDTGTSTPTTSPTSPTNIPTIYPTKNPTKTPTLHPSTSPSINPSFNPSSIPSFTPSISPTQNPSQYPTSIPTQTPSKYPSSIPTKTPSISPTKNPTITPSLYPSMSPLTPNPTIIGDTENPSISPTVSTMQPTKTPTVSPTKNPSQTPSKTPSQNPSQTPSKYPSLYPSKTPSQNPSQNPTKYPSIYPSKSPTLFPTTTPSFNPSENPSITPTTNTPTMSPITKTPTTMKPTNNFSKKRFIVQISTPESSVNVDSRVNLLGDIINYEKSKLKNIYYEWEEMNGLLNSTDIHNYKDTVYDNSYNLILRPNVLKSGQIYTFRLVTRQYRYPIIHGRRLIDDNNTEIGYGESSGIDIYMYKIPTIRENTFKVTPLCVNQYESIYDLLATSHTITLSADDDYVPLLYQFGYIDITNITHYFNPSLLTEASINNIYLYAGNFTLFGTVINTKSAESTKYKQCSIKLLDYSQCIINWKSNIIDAYINDRKHDLTFSVHDKYSFVFSQTNVYLHYLYDYIPANNTNNTTDTCFEESIKQIIETLHQYITNDSCVMSKWTILLSESMSLLLNLIYSHAENVAEIFYMNDAQNNYLAMIQDLLFMNLDPCGCVQNFTNVDDLYTSDQSIVTQIPFIYHKGEYISHCLSPIVSNPQYHQLLCALSSPVIDFINSIPYNEAITLYKLLLDVIYIQELTLISTSIPGTQICAECIDVNMCTLRIDTQCGEYGKEVIVYLSETTVEIANDIICNNTLSDIVIIEMDGASMENNNDEKCGDSSVVENTISVTISASGNINNDSIAIFDTSELSNDIIFTIPCVGTCDETFECVWFNEEEHKWDNSGCNTTIVYALNELICQCSHLTAFATIHNIHNLCENPFIMEWLASDLWDALIWIFFAIFLMIFFYSMFACIYYHIICRWKNINILGIFLIGITALLYAFICIYGYFTKQSLLNNDFDKNRTNITIKTYALFLLLPQITYFMIFTIIFYSWFCLAHSIFLPDRNIINKKISLKYFLYGCNVLLWIFLTIYYVLSFNANSDSNIFVIGAIIWAVLIMILTIIFVVYSCLANKIFYKTHQQMKHLYDDEIFEYTSLKILLIINAFTAIYFIFLCITCIYFALNPSTNQTVGYMIAYYIIDIIFLIFLLYMFRNFSYKNEGGKHKHKHKFDCKTEPLTPAEQVIEMNKQIVTPLTTNGTPDNENKFKLKIDTIDDDNDDENKLRNIWDDDDDIPKLDIFAKSAPQAILTHENEHNKTPLTAGLLSQQNQYGYDHTLIVSQFKKIEQDRKRKLTLEKERLQQIEEEKLVAELAAEILEKERLEQERMHNEFFARLEKEKEEKERKDKQEAERRRQSVIRKKREQLEQERLMKLEEERLEKERLEYERLEYERLEKEEKEAKENWSTDEDEEYDDFEEKIENIDDLMSMNVPKDVEKILGNREKYKMPENAKKRDSMERDLRKLLVFDENDKDEIKYAKMAICKFYDILIETFRKYCKIGGDNDWLTLRGWDALYKDAFICDKKLVNKCTEKECHALFNIIYSKHNGNMSVKKMSLRRSQILQKKQNKFSTRTMILSEWNDSDPWTGLWMSNDPESDEIYKMKQIGDRKIKGFIKSFEFCDINGSLKGSSDKSKAEMIVFWHSGARKNKRRFCKCILNKPASETDAVTMTVKWKSIPISSIVDQITVEKGEYLMTKMEKQLTNQDEEIFKYHIGLARHEYLDAMLVLSQMKFWNLNHEKKYAKLTKLCQDNLIPFIWGGMENAQQVTIKQIFRPYSTELHRLFDKYAGNKLLALEEWQMLCIDVFKQDKHAFVKGGKPDQIDIYSSYQLSLEGYDLELTYKLFERALQNVTHKLYKRSPKAKYVIMKYPDKLKKLLKWCVKLEKSGKKPNKL